MAGSLATVPRVNSYTGNGCGLVIGDGDRDLVRDPFSEVESGRPRLFVILVRRRSPVAGFGPTRRTRGPASHINFFPHK